VGCEILGNNLIGPHVIEGSLASYYRNFLEYELLLHIENVLPATYKRIWLCDRIHMHFGIVVTEFFNKDYGGSWIEELNQWLGPLGSPNLNSLGFFV
jgi:hypothetical protein